MDEKRKVKAGEDGEGGVGHVQVLQAVLQTLEDGGRDNLERVVGERKMDKSWRATEGLLVDLVDGVEREVQVDDVLYLVEERVGDEFDLVAGKVQVLKTALHRVERLHWDFTEIVESHSENFKFCLAEDTFREIFNLVVREIENSEVFLSVQRGGSKFCEKIV